MAYTKTNWVNDSVPAINAGNLNKIEQGIYEAHENEGTLSNLNTTNKTNLVNAINEVNTNDINSKTYSTSEIVIGKWMNKPLYRKVIDVGSHNWNTGDHTFPHNISNLGTVIKNQWIGFYNNKWYYAWDNLTTQNIIANSTNILIYCTSSGATFTQNYIILEYTKTTD